MRAPSVGQSPAAVWLMDPKNRKTALGGGALVLATLLILAGDSGVKLIGVVLAAGAWVVFFRVAPSDTATFRIRTRLEREEVAGLAAEQAANLKGPLSRVILKAGTHDRLDFAVTGTLSRPLEFHADMWAEADGTVSVSATIDTWTRNRITVWFIPIPFSSTIDGFGLYKKFGDSWTADIRRYDPTATVEYLRKPR